MNIVNWTPHEITITDSVNQSHIVPTYRVPDDYPLPEWRGLYVLARRDVIAQEAAITFADGTSFPVSRSTFTSAYVGLFKRVNDVEPVRRIDLHEALNSFGHGAAADNVYVVSRIFLEDTETRRRAGTYNIFAPGALVRDDAGKIVGARGFSA